MKMVKKIAGARSNPNPDERSVLGSGTDVAPRGWNLHNRWFARGREVPLVTPVLAFFLQFSGLPRLNPPVSSSLSIQRRPFDIRNHSRHG